jgi:NAD(P)-dependent dehydrogenase (short-subunit alcohol dehydrogenase family)
MTLPSLSSLPSLGKLLTGKRTLITGGSRGLGRAIALSFARHGAKVAVSYAKNEEAARATLEELRALGAEALSFKVDACDSAATDEMIRSLEKAWDGLDVLVNNAAITQNLPLALLEEEDFDKVMRVNVKGPFITSRAVLRGMIRRKSGVVVNIGSLAGARMIEAPIHYTTSKAAIIGMTEALAKEVARHGIRVVCLAPGLLEDGLGKNLPDHRLADYLKHCALGRVGRFDEVAEVCSLLASERSSYVSGETLVMDGGV